MSRPILYSFRRCPYAMRARMAIRSAGVLCELREVVLRDKPKEMLEASPKGTVPVVVREDGAVIEESEDVMLWALGQNDPEGWLSPESGSLDEMRTLIARCEAEFKPHLDRYKYAARYEGADPAEHRSLAAAFLVELDARLSTFTFLFGTRRALADVAIAPFVRQFANTDRDWFDAEPWPHLIKWLDAFCSWEGFQAVMAKHARWEEGEGIAFP